MPRDEDDEPKLIETLSPDMKEVSRQAKAFRKANREHKEAQNDLKKRRDTAERKLIVAMHDAKMKPGSYRFDGMIVELTEQDEKVSVKDAPNSSEASDD